MMNTWSLGRRCSFEAWKEDFEKNDTAVVSYDGTEEPTSKARKEARQ